MLYFYCKEVYNVGMVKQAQSNGRNEMATGKIVCRVEAKRGAHYAEVFENGSYHETLVFSHIRLQQTIRRYHALGYRMQFSFEYFYR